jgi:dihydroxyacetone kinase-like protein
MSAAFTAASDFAEVYGEDDIGMLLSKAGMAMSKAAPSTMGTLMGTGFMRGGKALKGKNEIGLPDLSLFWDAFVTGLMDRGKAKPGDKTIIDALYPAMLVLKEEADENTDIYPAFLKAQKAANDGVETAKALQAQFGKAAYYGEKSRGQIDPGSIVGKLLIDTFTEYFKG